MTGNLHNRCLAVLREGLNGDEFWPVIYAAETLTDASYTFEVLPVLHARLENETDLRNRAGIARALIRAGERHALVELQDILLTDDTEARVLAAEALFLLRDLADVELVRSAMDSSEDGRLRLYAAAALAAARDEDTIEVIREGLASDNPALRFVGADVMTGLGNRDDDLPALLLNLDRAASDFERFYTLRALAFLGHEPARVEIAGLLAHPDPTIRSRAAYATAETWLIQETERLIALLDDPTLAVRVRAAQALLILSTPQSPYRFRQSRY
jgi:HEAT repeat protein